MLTFSQDGKCYHDFKAYGQAKTAVILFVVALATKAPDERHIYLLATSWL